MLLVHYYGAGEWMDIVKIDHENPNNSDITRKGLMCPQDHILALDYREACMLINAGSVTTQALIPVDISNTPSRGKLIFHLPKPHIFKNEDVVTKYLDKRLEDITIQELQKMYGFTPPSTANIQDGIKTDGKTELKPVIKNNDFEFSGLLKIPAKKDDWFQVIDDMTLAFYNKYGKRPNEVQAWGQLWTSPPDGYAVTTGKDKGEDCLFMPSVKSLSRSAFKKRWNDYTANNDE